MLPSDVEHDGEFGLDEFSTFDQEMVEAAGVPVVWEDREFFRNEKAPLAHWSGSQRLSRATGIALHRTWPLVAACLEIEPRSVGPVNPAVGEKRERRMAYWFTGFFARPTVQRPETLPRGGVWRDIATPFLGVGVRLSASGDDEELANPADVQALAGQLGLFAADSWVYLSYVCWGGRIDFVYGLGCRDGVPFGPVEESAHDKVKAAYTDLMEQFGISAADALRFEPFVRGYWGEA